MNFMISIKYGFRFKNVYIALEAVKKIINWPVYFLDLFSLLRNRCLVFRMRNGLKYMVRAATGDRGVVSIVDLADEYDKKHLFLPRNSTVVDVGAHIGIFSVYISDKAARVFAYEPVLANYNILERNIKLNNLENKIKVFNCAVSGKKEKLRMHISKVSTAMHSSYIYRNNDDYMEVAAITLKEIFDTNNIGRCELLKIDAEGAEYGILYGLPADYFKRINRVYLEYHDIDAEDKEYNYNFLKEYLIKNGFRVTTKGRVLFADNAHENM